MHALRRVAGTLHSVGSAAAGVGVRIALAAPSRSAGAACFCASASARRLQHVAFSTSAPATAATEAYPRDVSVADIRWEPKDPEADELIRATFDDPVAAGRLVHTPGLLWEAAQKDAAAAGETPQAYLVRVRAATESFRDGVEADGLRPVVWCPATLTGLRRLGDDAGEGPQFVTGSRSVGKSHMLEKLAVQLKKDKRQMLLYDTRLYSTDLVRGFVGCIAADRELLKAVVHEAPLDDAATIVRIAEHFGPRIVDRIAGVNVDALPDAELTVNRLLDAFIAACQSRGEHPVIAIDETNRLVWEPTAADTERTVGLMQYFTRVTKQERTASVVLATTDHQFLWHLKKMGYNTGHVSTIMHVDEVPPAVMKRLLVETWGCGEHLASMLLKLFGGHVMYSSQGLLELAYSDDPGSLTAARVYCYMTGAPGECFSDRTFDEAGVPRHARDALRTRMREVLRALVVDGFVPLETPWDDVAVVASLAHVGRIVEHGAFAVSVPQQAWTAHTPSGRQPLAVLVPSFHIMRVLIARTVFPARDASAGGGIVAALRRVGWSSE